MRDGVHATGGQGNSPVARLINEAAKLLGVAISVTPADLANRDEWSGPEYAAPSVQSQEAMRLAAVTEALILDPRYSAKGMAGLIGTIRSGLFRAGETVVFIHTGGQPALFAYHEEPASDGD